MHTKLAIIGSGPAGYTASIYAARSNLSPMMIMGNLPGGQLLYTHQIENFPGFENVSGSDLIDSCYRQTEILNVKKVYEDVRSINLKSDPFVLNLTGNKKITAESIIIACGASPRWLNVKGEERFKGKGISVCATCDGYFYRGKDVVVIGGGNTALYETLFLSSFVNHIFLINKDRELSGEYNLKEQVRSNPKVQIIKDSTVTSFDGEEKLNSIWIKNIRTLEVQKIDVDGAFVAIGQVPNTALFSGQLKMDPDGYIVTDCYTKQTSVEGVFAAGDVQEKQFRQAIVACGTGAIAALSAEKYLLEKKS